ncbi:MAG: hypothetical protein IJ231_05860 [Clostridia bacterium]|nr:hypothetical protein [Clostridia bacterium]
MDAQDMDRQVEEAYRRELLKEREGEIRERTLKKVQVITRSMRPEEEAEYLRSKAFQNALNQTRKKAHTYQAIRGEALPEEWQAEFQRLRPLIQAELRAGHKVELPFLRSVARSRRPLREARQARKWLEEEKPRLFLSQQAGRVAGDLDREIMAWLSRGDLSSLIIPEETHGSVAESLMKRVFRDGIPRQALDEAVPEGSLEKNLEKRVFRQYPALGHCKSLSLSPGGTVGDSTRRQIREAEPEVLLRVRAHFPQGRIRKHLKQNPHIKAWQKERDRNRSDRKNLREALLKAIPEEMKDLYPLARGMRRRFILHLGPTNSGKTWESIQRLQTARHGIYLGPLRLLAFEQFEGMNLADVPCSLVTGEEQILVPDSRIQSSTIEIADMEAEYDIAVIDECQMISDRDRGGAWSAAVLGLCAEEIHICASPDAERLLAAMIADCGDEMTVVRHERMAPLAVEEGGFHFPSGVRKGDALIVFSKARVHALAAELKQMGYAVSLIYGALPPDVRRNQAERFRRGETDVVVSTDAIAMGMNLPIARVVFMESEKFDGDITRQLTDSEIRQIAGRAGRYGQYDIGYVNAFGFKPMVAAALSRPAVPLTTAVIRFPESLLGLPLPLTEILNQWIGMKDKSYFSKASTMRMMSLAARMETPRTDKRLLYDFLCIPFDEEDPRLLEEWKNMYHAESGGRHFDVEAILPAFRDPEACTVAMLDRLEGDYRLCDLCYNYARRFLENPESLLREIQQRKDLISSGIIHVLSTQKLPGRRCRTCGRSLSWNWPYAICDHCYAQGQPQTHGGRRGGRRR